MFFAPVATACEAWRRVLRVATAALLTSTALAVSSLDAQAAPFGDGDRAWRAGHEAALRGRADSAMTAYREALRLAQQDKDQELAAAARLGMAEVWDVWRRCRDSARVAYEDAMRLTSEGDYGPADAFVIWLARQGDQAGARALHARAYTPIENQVPRTVTRESVNFLLGLAQIQIANSSRSGALSSLNAARSIADRLAFGDQNGQPSAAITPSNYWALHDIAALLLDPNSRNVRNVATGSNLRRELDAATSVNDNGEHPRFTVGRLADRVARARRTCKTADCRLPPPPAVARCR